MKVDDLLREAHNVVLNDGRHPSLLVIGANKVNDILLSHEFVALCAMVAKPKETMQHVLERVLAMTVLVDCDQPDRLTFFHEAPLHR